jgi:hypothetical protein
MCHSDLWLNQQHWYLFEAHVHFLEEFKWFYGSYGVYDAENDYAKLGDLSNYSGGVNGLSLEQARLDGAFVYTGELVSPGPPPVFNHEPHTGLNYPWQLFLGTEGNAAQVITFPYERFSYAAPAVATGGFPPRLPALG